MTKIVAAPSKTAIFNFELPRLSTSLHGHLQLLRGSPCRTSLAHFENTSATSLANSISRVSVDAYNAAALAVGSSPEISTQMELRRLALVRGKSTASLMSKSSEVPLKIKAAMSKVRVASLERAAFASNYELRLAFFLGTTRGWQLNKRAKKGWLLSSGHDLDDMCDENFEQGLISVFDFFNSGVMYAPAHIGCVCDMYLVLPQDNPSKK